MSDEQSTPQQFFDGLNKQFDFDLDVCASDTNHKCDNYYTKDEHDALDDSTPWGSICWMNPPYSDPGPWIKKAYEESKQDHCMVVALLRNDCSTKAFNEYVTRAQKLFFVSKRLKFNNVKGTPNFSNIVVVFSTYHEPDRTWNVLDGATGEIIA